MSRSTSAPTKPCKGGQHSWEEVFRAMGGDWDEDAVVMWCAYCGSLVVDAEFDGRTYPGRLVPIRVSVLAKAFYDGKTPLPIPERT